MTLPRPRFRKSTSTVRPPGNMIRFPCPVCGHQMADGTFKRDEAGTRIVHIECPESVPSWDGHDTLIEQ
jgi:predicted RNA-binding Zn-ribbon protein involved in translation (DUF1610 family)